MCFYIYFYVSASDLYIDRLATGLYIDRPEKKVKNCPNQKKNFNIPFYAKKFKNMKFCKILTNISILGINAEVSYESFAKKKNTSIFFYSYTIVNLLKGCDSNCCTFIYIYLKIGQK